MTVACPECHRRSGFELVGDGRLRCPNCGTEFDPFAERGDPNAPNNTWGFTSDAIDPDGDEAGTFWCPDCGKRVTRSRAGVEYGHKRGMEAGEDRCERRPHPAVVDTDDGRKAAGYATDALRDREDNNLPPRSPLRKGDSA